MLRLIRLLVRLLLGAILLSVAWVALYIVVDPPLTSIQARDRLNGTRVRQHWVPLSAISRAMPRAAIGAEDANFCRHHGFDVGAIEKAAAANARGKALRGGSTISQQVAKNVFLWPGRSYVRKALEAWFTLLTEQLWGKHRIMEVYLNVAEMGDGIYGVDAAAHEYFSTSAHDLSATQAARLAAILPNPVERDAATPTPGVRRYANRIQKREGFVAREGYDGCLR